MDKKLETEVVDQFPALGLLMEFFQLNDVDPNDALNAMFYLSIKVLKHEGFNKKEYMKVAKMFWENYEKSIFG